MPNNIEMLQIVAKGLGDLKNEVVFVGGAVAELYADNPAASDIRPTTDVDCVIELSSRSSFAKLEEALRKKGFKNDTTKGAPICRYIYKGVKVDVMPTDSKLLGFTNKWYEEGIENKITKQLHNKTEIFIFSPEYYLAAKLEAFKNRGGNDLRQSHDFEDIIYILDNCNDILENINTSNSTVKKYLKEKFSDLLNNENLMEGIECALPLTGDTSVDYTEIIYELMKHISETK
ncbi:MAG TPA: hypothetical protein P5509_10010 [Bacteroidales bacterium]|nr:hypothetical protein [Bacteroidales bacterium]